MSSNTVKYRNFFVIRLPRRWVVKNGFHSKVGDFESLEAAKAYIDRLMKGGDRTDASDYGCPI
jgi:hypothetical protein